MVKKSINIICLILGIAVVIFAALVRFGAIAGVDPGRSSAPFVLGLIIIAWACISLLRNRGRNS